MLQNELRKIESELEDKHARTEAYIQSIIKELKSIIVVATKRLKKINSDLRAIKTRLNKYLKPNVDRDETYYDLKDRYIELLKEREQYLLAISTAEESISLGRLHSIGEEGNRQ